MSDEHEVGEDQAARFEEIPPRQYVRLIESLGDRLHRRHGWKQEVAEQLGISASHLSKILSGERKAGPELRDRAADRLGFARHYFGLNIDFDAFLAREKRVWDLSLNEARKSALRILVDLSMGEIITEERAWEFFGGVNNTTPHIMAREASEKMRDLADGPTKVRSLTRWSLQVAQELLKDVEPVSQTVVDELVQTIRERMGLD